MLHLTQVRDPTYLIFTSLIVRGFLLEVTFCGTCLHAGLVDCSVILVDVMDCFSHGCQFYVVHNCNEGMLFVAERKGVLSIEH
jgi:hypothetical protein